MEVFQVFDNLAGELDSHMQKEEHILFPAIQSMVGEEAEPVVLEGPISVMLQEHDEASAGLARLRHLTNSYQPPPGACNTYRALFAGLAELEEDLHCHIHLENEVLFPQARELTAQLSS